MRDRLAGIINAQIVRNALLTVARECSSYLYREWLSCITLYPKIKNHLVSVPPDGARYSDSRLNKVLKPAAVTFVLLQSKCKKQ